ncbi:MAG: PAS domain S-box protein [Methylacidiphilales bacterium]|nr:PAS domain S-box protein [Candidatus Methylacidiphilales bacterium]
MSKTHLLPEPVAAELAHWTEQLREAERHLRDLLGDDADTVLGAKEQPGLQRIIVDGEKRCHGAEEEPTIAVHHLQQILDSSLDVICTLDANGGFIQVNAACEKIWGYTPSELIGTTCTDLVLPEDRSKTLEMRAGIQKGKVTHDFENRYVRKNGAIVDMMWSATWSQSKQCMFCVGRDMTESHRASETIRRNEGTLIEAQRIARFGSWEADYDEQGKLIGNSLRWSDEVFRIFGFEPGGIEVSNETFFNSVHPDDREAVWEAVLRAEREGRNYMIDHRIILPDGAIRYVHEEAQFTRDPVTKKPLKIIGIVQDITEQKAADQKLAEQAALLDEARDAIMVRNLVDHKILFWNKGAERIYGWTADQALGKKATELFYHSLDKFQPAMQMVMQKGAWSGEVEQYTIFGEPVVVEGRWTLLRDAAGQPKSILCINTDITERKKMESHFLRAQRMESIGTLAGGIAHDLNNLLAPIIMGVDLLKHFGVDGPCRKVVDDIERSARRGSSLVKQVLSFARGVEGTHIPLQMREVIDEIESIIKNTFPKNIALQTNISGDIWPVLGDPTQLNQVILNLCLNARDAMPEGGRIYLSAANRVIDTDYEISRRGVVAGRYVCLDVADTGCGIPEENIEKIFDPFFTTKELAKGTGLGLATTLGIVRSHGGFVNVYSEVGRGTTFKVYLPAQTGNVENAVDDAAAGDWPRGKGECILLVDDEASILTVTQQTLEAFGYSVLAAENGAQAVSLFAMNRDKVSLLLTDMMMPVMDGAATIEALRLLDPKLRVVAASGLNANGNIVLNHAGVKHFLAKPYTTGALLSTLRAALAEGI